jgi:protease-4
MNDSDENDSRKIPAGTSGEPLWTGKNLSDPYRTNADPELARSEAPGSIPTQSSSTSGPSYPQGRKRNEWAPVLWVFGTAILLLILLVGSLGAYLGLNPRETVSGVAHQGGVFSREAVGVIDLKGVILDSKRFLREMKTLQEEKDVKALVIRINSPGGAVAPSQEIHQAISQSEKPVVISMGSVAASGGFYAAVAGTKVYANPGTITGSVGVIMEFVNLEKLYEWAKVKRYSLTTGRFKGMGADYKEMGPEERAILQTMIDRVLGQFVKAVAEGRKMSEAEVRSFADGRIFSGEQAFEMKLVDALGSYEDAVKAAAELANIKGKPRVVTPARRSKNVLLELFMEDFRREDSDDAEAHASLGLKERARDWISEVVGRPNEILEPGIYWLWRGN